MKNRRIGNIQKVADGKYKIRISVGTDDFGKRIVINKTIEAKSDLEAERALMKLYADRHKITKQAAAPGTLEKLYETFRENHLNALAPNTKNYYETLWKHIDKFGKLKLENLDIKNINKLLSAIPEGKIRNACFKMLKTMINKGIAWGEFNSANPCDFISTPKYNPPEKKVLNDSDIDIINRELKKEDIKYQCIFYFACLLGMRRQEILALKWNDINFKTNEVSIVKAASLSHDPDQDRIIIKETKTENSKRKLFLPELLIRKLKLLRKEQTIRRLKLGDIYKNKDFVFTQWNGEIMNVHTPTNWWRDFVKEHELSPVTFHGLRHSAASIMIGTGQDVATVSKTLGHSNTSTTLNIYTHLIEDSKKDAVLSVAGKFAMNK